MAQRIINLGLTPNDGNGDPIRVGGQKINDNFSEIFPLLNNKVSIKLIIPDALSGIGTIKEQVLEYLNSLNPYEVKRDEVLVYKLPIFSGPQSILASDNYLFTSHHYFHKVGSGMYGQGAIHLNGSDITDPIISQESSDIVDLGDVYDSISVEVNNSGPYREKVFKGSRSGVDFLYMYVGDEELIGQGASQTVENDFVDLMNQSINLDSYLTNLDLFDRYTYLEFENEGSVSGLTEKYYLIRLKDTKKYYFITNEAEFVDAKILLKGLGAVDTGDVTTRDVNPGYDMYELFLPTGFGQPQAMLEVGQKYWFTFWRYFGSSGEIVHTQNTSDIELSGDGTDENKLKATLQPTPNAEDIFGRLADGWQPIIRKRENAAFRWVEIVDSDGFALLTYVTEYYDTDDSTWKPSRKILIGTSYSGALYSNRNVVAIGFYAARHSAGSYITAIGIYAADNAKGDYINANGYLAASNSRGDHINAFGKNAALNSLGSYINVFGEDSYSLQQNFDHVNIFGSNLQPTKSNQNIISGEEFLMPDSTVSTVLAAGNKSLATVETVNHLVQGASNGGIPKEEKITGTRYTNTSASGVLTFDMDSYKVFDLILTGNTDFQIQNPPTGTETKVIEGLVTGNHGLELPSDWVPFPNNDDYIGSMTNHIVVTFIKSGYGGIFYSLQNIILNE